MQRKLLDAIGLLLALTWWSHAALAAGPNLVPNGTFDTDLSDWIVEPYQTCGFPGGACWTRIDADDSRTSGSAHLIPVRDLVYVVTLTSSCVSIAGGDDYVVDLDLRLDFSGLSDAEASPLWFADPECQTTGELEKNSVSSGDETWAHSRHILTAPADAVAVRLLLRVRVYTTAYFDNVRLVHLIPGESTTTTTLACEGDCGNPLLDVTPTTITPSDALYVLRSAIGVRTCPLCICDVNDDGDIGATDALLTLAAAVRQGVTLTCPPP